MTDIARRLQALETSTPRDGVSCIVRRFVTPGHLGDEVQIAEVYGVTVARGEGEAEAGFIGRAQALALAGNPAPGRIVRLSFE